MKRESWRTRALAPQPAPRIVEHGGRYGLDLVDEHVAARGVRVVGHEHALVERLHRAAGEELDELGGLGAGGGAPWPNMPH